MYIVEYKRYSTLSYIIFPAGRDKAVAQRGYGKRGHMTTKECYELMGADYEDVLGRLMTEKLVKKFLYKFADAKDMEELKTSLEAKDYNTAFRMAHNLKGVCANLSITRLGASVPNCVRNSGTAITRTRWSPCWQRCWRITKPPWRP